MEKLVIHGGRRLEGRVKISGAKNAVLPIIAATLLGQDSPSLLDEVPALEDVHTITEVLQKLGVKAEFRKETHQLFVDSTVIGSCEAPYDLVRKMRASFLIMGPLLARCGQAKISLPGGCAIGTRPIDLHLKGFEALGAQIRVEGRTAIVEGVEKLTPANIQAYDLRAGAAMLIAALAADGVSEITNVQYIERGYEDIIGKLRALGARIDCVEENDEPPIRQIG